MLHNGERSKIFTGLRKIEAVRGCADRSERNRLAANIKRRIFGELYLCVVKTVKRKAQRYTALPVDRNLISEMEEALLNEVFGRLSVCGDYFVANTCTRCLLYLSL